ncbi:uncharacterized protein B0T23DRAFT_308531 [Neurospora hispaniola]|uniref:Uncharacterized protein n=1 Tax=Neurospora hispaniola TaxID=588809 RepID=A0AAJ0IG62_9PEZI|nr:hypothetical protein B0T23DRAFT_308531 [Neurospora hispaniola]
MTYFCKSRFRKRHPIMFRGSTSNRYTWTGHVAPKDVQVRHNDMVGRSTLASRQITAFRSGVETSLTAMSDGRATGERSPTAHTRLDRQKQASTPATLGNTQFLPAKTGRDDAPHGAFDRPHNLTMMVTNCEN